MFRIGYLIFFHFVATASQINLYSTDEDQLQHDCLRVITSNSDLTLHRQVISYCMSEPSLKFNFETSNSFFRKFTFAELSAKKISSGELYAWSAPVDLIERYQSYVLTSNDLMLGEEFYYNCTGSRFGPKCQYQFNDNAVSLYEIVHNFYLNSVYSSTDLTCYAHLECNRGHSSICLDWTEICDGHVHCLNDKMDEKDCWPLEINECNDNEYRCKNGQCIPKSFYGDDSTTPDCLDRTDEYIPAFYDYSENSFSCRTNEPSFACDDSQCIRTGLTSSCMKTREELLIQKLFSVRDNSTNDKCWSTFNCFLQAPTTFDSVCIDRCKTPHDRYCHEIILNECPDFIHIATIPLLFGDIHFVYPKNDLKNPSLTYGRRYPYLCHQNSIYDTMFLNYQPIFINNLTCYPYELRYAITPLIFGWGKHLLHLAWTQFRPFHEPFNYNSTICNRSNMYQCEQSLKCISIFRFKDKIRDCPNYDDDYILIEPLSDNVLGISSEHHEENKRKLRYIKLHISFQTICDGFTELYPINITGELATDETECQEWECNNIYTRCNGLWNCWSGEDEADCNFLLPFNCTTNSHLCISRYTNKFMCLPIENADDGKVDCLGGFDEPRLCRSRYTGSQFWESFHCLGQSGFSACIDSRRLCDGYQHCPYADDEQFCRSNRTYITNGGLCLSDYAEFRSDVEQFLCKTTNSRIKDELIYFSLNATKQLTEQLSRNTENKIVPYASIDQSFYCHRGLNLHVYLNNLTTMTCLCPPSYYGDRCQYQNQRVSLTIKFRTFLDSEQTLYAIIVSLIDEDIIHSYEQMSYLSTRDCSVKYNVYLLYATRPKNALKQHSIRIDIYEKISLTYRASLIYPVDFPFLSVYRLSVLADIPQNDGIKTCSNRYCVHGQCMYYSNNRENDTFCQCDKGWFGHDCSIQGNCTCSSDALCIGIDGNNRSICVCPIHKFGPRCFLADRTCQNSTCQNGGQCVPNDEYVVSHQKRRCICPNSFIGDRCEIQKNTIVLSFEENLVVSESIFIHLIQVINNNFPVRSTTLKTISNRRDALSIRWSLPFHIVFIELLNKKAYYWVHVQNTYKQSEIITKTVHPSDRCLHIREIFNESFLQMHLIRRIKYYHLPCQKSSLNLSCFHDEAQFCLCYDFRQRRLANCFDFDHNMTSHCLSENFCKNNGHCFQDHPTCPQRTMCTCPPCFYGARCQFSTSGFGLSLDAILGYHIRPYRSIVHQPFIVRMSLALNIIFVVVGLTNGLFALMTFKSRNVRVVGCGIYLLGSSVATLLTTLLFGLKFWILVLAQMNVISNRLFLRVQCVSLDFTLRVCLNMNQWLNACVACERAVTTMKGPSFSKKKSKQVAKFVAIILMVVVIGNAIDDPTHRSLIDEKDDNENRIWCIVSYSSSFTVYNYVMHCFNFFIPFLINLISAIVLIAKKTRQKSSIQSQQTLKKLFRQQFREHKHLLTAPIVLVIFALPQLILTFVSKCMHSVDDSWLFLTGYFISFIPPMLTCTVFILPSTFYKKQFHKSLVQYRTYIEKRIPFI